jgi:hypothetical protein
LLQKKDFKYYDIRNKLRHLGFAFNLDFKQMIGAMKMNISRKLGILVFCGVPAIVGGGIMYALFDSYVPVFIYESLLLLVAGGIISR